MRKTDKTLGKILLEKNLISEVQLNEALQEQKKSREFLGRILLNKGYIKEEDLLKALAQQFNLEVATLKYHYLDINFLKNFSQTLIFDHGCIPIKQDEDLVTFAINNPLDTWTIKMAEEEAKGKKAKFVLASKQEIGEIISRYKEYLKREIIRGI